MAKSEADIREAIAQFVRGRGYKNCRIGIGEDAKKRLQQMYGFDHDTVLLLEADAVFSCMNTEDWHEGIRSFKEGRAPEFKGV